MSFDKAIKSGKEKRKPYRKSKAFDGTCRNHGSCPWCERNRKHFDVKSRFDADDEIKNWELEQLVDEENEKGE